MHVKLDFRADPSFNHFAVAINGGGGRLIGNWSIAKCPCGWLVESQIYDDVILAALSHNDWYKEACR